MTLGEVLVSESDIAHAIPDIVLEILDDYGDAEPLLVGVMDGAVCFLADLMRAFPHSMDVVTAHASSYDGTEPGRVTVDWLPPRDRVEGRDVIIVEDIVDSGATAILMRENLTALGALSVEVCALLDKPSRRTYDIEVAYAGFDLPDVFVVGYGLDYKGEYRNLPDVRELVQGDMATL